MSCKYLCFFLVVLLGVSLSKCSSPSITIRNSKEMSAEMKLEAVDVLKDAFNSNSELDPCEVLADSFQNKYPDFNWHVVDFNAYSVRASKSLSMAVDDKYYLLFATKK